MRALRAQDRCDAAVERIAEADFGCEECAEMEKVWVLLLTTDGAEHSMELPAALCDRLALEEGGLCRLSDLTPLPE